MTWTSTRNATPRRKPRRPGHDRALAAMAEKLGGPAAAMEIMSAAQFGDAPTVPDDPGELT